MEKILSEQQIKDLRDRQIISSQEIAMVVGDLLIAEDVVTRQRRVLEKEQQNITETKRLLQG
jgi:hypothetical protein